MSRQYAILRASDITRAEADRAYDRFSDAEADYRSYRSECARSDTWLKIACAFAHCEQTENDRHAALDRVEEQLRIEQARRGELDRAAGVAA